MKKMHVRVQQSQGTKTKNYINSIKLFIICFKKCDHTKDLEKIKLCSFLHEVKRLISNEDMSSLARSFVSCDKNTKVFPRHLKNLPSLSVLLS